jgi:hypothetical protein
MNYHRYLAFKSAEIRQKRIDTYLKPCNIPFAVSDAQSKTWDDHDSDTPHAASGEIEYRIYVDETIADAWDKGIDESEQRGLTGEARRQHRLAVLRSAALLLAERARPPAE